MQFHFHAPSEHTLIGEELPAELHLVHKASDGSLAVVGLMLTTGDGNAALKPAFGNLPPEVSEEAEGEGSVNAALMLPAKRATYRYSGSPTTPPCSEGVSWFAMTQPVTISKEQLAAYAAIFDGNNRPMQPRNARTLSEDVMR